MRSRSFIYANSSIRVDGVQDPHKDWYPTAAALWNQHINWDGAKAYISQNCHGTTAGAKIIELTLNTLNKYTGKNGLTTVTKQDNLAYGITQDLIDSLRQLDLGETSARSLLNYVVTGEGQSTALNAGFSFESRMSEFIQRLAGTDEFSSKSERQKLRSGAEYTYAGESTMFYLGDFSATASKKGNANLVKTILDDMGKEYSDLVTYIYEEVQRNIDGNIQPDIAVVAYKVPQKADITVPSYMTISSSYGPLVSNFLRVISNARISLKNTSQAQITLGATNDNTRLRAFISQFANGIKKDFATVCTFLFSSKASGNSTVQRYLDWSRIIYELTGAGQRANLNDKNSLLVDYLIINNYTTNGSSGQASVYSMKDLINAFPIPNGNYDPPFKIFNKGGDSHAGEVKIDLNEVAKFSFSH